MSSSSTDGVFFTVSTTGDFPVVSGIISNQGSLLHQQGIDYHSPFIKRHQDGGLLILAQPSEPTSPAIIVKTLPDGTIPSCEDFNACVTLEDFQLYVTNTTWEQHPTLPLPEFTFNVTPSTIVTADYCNTNPYPTPQFSLPDTVCQGTCLRPTELNNQLANHAEWQIVGPGLDTIIADTSFNWCFDTPGTWFIDHSVWVLGCADVASHRLTVLSDDLTPPLPNDTTACSLPLTVALQSSRPLQSALWDNGFAGTQVGIPATGTYAVVASDGFCSVRDTFTVSDIRDAYPLPWVSIPDTAICRDQLPFALMPISSYTNQFTLDGQPFNASTDIHQPGRYRIGLQIEHCPADTLFNLSTENCTAQVYIPNAFSPNNDGINDLLRPLGINFQVSRLQVFDRWGGLLYESSDPQAAWDGTRLGKPAPQGTYIVLLEFFNTRNLQVENISAEVWLGR
ncbi:MAG: gliding motility-associated C-terminal domain-containing protein [Saprospiraceae bacterium]